MILKYKNINGMTDTITDSLQLKTSNGNYEIYEIYETENGELEFHKVVYKDDDYIDLCITPINRNQIIIE